MQKKLLILLLAVVLLIGGFILVWRIFSVERAEISSDLNKDSSRFTNWDMYENERLGIRFLYPAGFYSSFEGDDGSFVEFKISISSSKNSSIDESIRITNYYSSPDITGDLELNAKLFQENHQDYTEILSDHDRKVFLGKTANPEQITGVILFPRDMVWFLAPKTDNLSLEESEVIIRKMLLSFEKALAEMPSHETILQKIRISPSQSVEIKISGDLDLVVFQENGTETIIDGRERSGLEKLDSSVYTDLAFKVGRYIQYRVYGWEWSAVRLYDIQDKKRVVELSSNFRNGFTEEGRYFYACAVSQFGGELYADIYSLPQFEKRGSFFEENKEYTGEDIMIENLDCVYEKDKNLIKIFIDYFNVSEVGNDAYFDKYKKKAIWEYSFDTGNFEKIIR